MLLEERFAYSSWATVTASPDIVVNMLDARTRLSQQPHRR